MVTLQLKQIRVQPGQRVILSDISWQEFEAILDELGEHRNSRVAYSQGTLEIIVPLPDRERIDLNVDPPPDLAIEIDVTSKTQLSAYQALKVPEIWRYIKGKLEISLLQEDKYINSQTSLVFPTFRVIEEIPRFVEMARTTGTTLGLRAFRKFVREYIAN